jgi:hypothetical protein
LIAMALSYENEMGDDGIEPPTITL